MSDSNDLDIVDEELDDEFNDNIADDLNVQENNAQFNSSGLPGSTQEARQSIDAAPQEKPEITKKDKTFQEMLDLMDGEFAPIIPDAVTNYYLNKNGFETADLRVKRLLALATQKFISDIAQDAYEYSRIRSSSAVYNSSNPQIRAKQLLQGQQFANQQSGGTSGNAEGISEQQPQLYSSNAGNQQGKIVLTMEDLSNALSEYGLNASRPDFYR